MAMELKPQQGPGKETREENQVELGFAQHNKYQPGELTLSDINPESPRETKQTDLFAKRLQLRQNCGGVSGLLNGEHEWLQQEQERQLREIAIRSKEELLATEEGRKGVNSMLNVAQHRARQRKQTTGTFTDILGSEKANNGSSQAEIQHQRQELHVMIQAHSQGGLPSVASPIAAQLVKRLLDADIQKS